VNIDPNPDGTSLTLISFAELGVPIRVLRTFQRFGCSLQAEPGNACSRRPDDKPQHGCRRSRCA
jgi:hypothetical protein